MEGRGDLTMASISLQDLKRRLYAEAKAEKTKRFWGLYVHVAKLETLRAAYESAKKHNGAPGIDGVTFAAIEAGGVEGWLGQLRDELVTRTYRPLRNRRVEIPKRGGKVRVLGIPTITAYCGIVPHLFRLGHRGASVSPAGRPTIARPLRASSGRRSGLHL